MSDSLMKGKTMDKCKTSPLAAWERELEAMAQVPVIITVAMRDGSVENISNVDARSIAFQAVPVIRKRGKRGKPVLALTFETCETFNPVIYTFPNAVSWSTLAE